MLAVMGFGGAWFGFARAHDFASASAEPPLTVDARLDPGQVTSAIRNGQTPPDPAVVAAAASASTATAVAIVATVAPANTPTSVPVPQQAAPVQQQRPAQAPVTPTPVPAVPTPPPASVATLVAARTAPPQPAATKAKKSRAS